MNNQHSIPSPPFDLVRQWMERTEYDEDTWFYESYIAEQAARWGADQQLAKDAEWLDQHALDAPHLKITPVGESLKEAMRPKPPSLKEQALDALREAESSGCLYVNGRSDIIRKALEALPND
jgi:hypothetical protein